MSFIPQKRLSFAILIHNSSAIPSEAKFLPKVARHRDAKGRNKENGHNGKSENPLESKSLDPELVDTKCCTLCISISDYRTDWVFRDNIPADKTLSSKPIV